jgi:hypothetical protein
MRLSFGFGLGRGGVYVPNPEPPGFETDLRLLPSASNLAVWWDASNGVTMSPALLGLGTSPPAVTITGTRTNASGKAVYIHVEEADVTRFRWNEYNGGGIGTGNGERNVLIPQGGSYALGATGRVANFAVGTYNGTQYWQAVAESVDAIHGGATMQLNNTAIGASLGPVIGIDRDWANKQPSLIFRPDWGTGGLQNTTGVPAIATGTNTPFHLFCVGQIISSNISTGGNTPWSFSHSTTTNGNYLDWRWYGPLSTVGAAGAGAQHMMVRRIPAGVPVQFGTLSTLSYGPQLWEAAYDGNVCDMYINGQLYASLTGWTTTALVFQRFMLGGIKLGTSAFANIPYMRWRSMAIYNSRLPENDNGSWGVRRALA